MYILNKDYEKAIALLEEALELKPNPIMRGIFPNEFVNIEGFALHNLAYAYWWNYNRYQSKQTEEIRNEVKKIQDLESEQAKETAERLEQGFREAAKNNSKIIPYFKRAIKSFECIVIDTTF